MKECLRKRLKGKLSITPYNAARAHAEFPFINKTFRPASRADLKEGGAQDEASITDITPKDRKCDLDPHSNPYVITPKSESAGLHAKSSVTTKELNTYVDATPSTPAVPSSVPRIKFLPPKKPDKNESSKGQSARNPWLMIWRKPGSVPFARSSSVIQSLSWWNRTR